MKCLVIILVCVQIFQVLSQDVETLVEEIEQVYEQAQNWTYPTDSYGYVLENYNPGVYINDGEYDFIIVGAGSSGTVVANRLSAVTGWKILLVEAGDWEDDVTDVPDLTDYLRTTDYNWGYNVQPQKDFVGYLDRAIAFPRGKGIGGTSLINAMIYARGNKDDYDRWGVENPGWNYDEVLPYFRRSEIATFPDASPLYHGLNGTLHVEYSKLYDEVGEAFLEAQNQLGRDVARDYNTEDQMVFSVLQLNEVNGRRDSGGKAFINPAKNRTNLIIRNNTLTTKLLIHHNNKTVYGVQYVNNGTFYYATAKKEVIVSAGSINTPQLLMLSGIGPRRHLKEMNIKLVKDLPVGDNLWDHIIYSAQAFTINYTYPDQNLTEQVQQYLQGEGVLTTADNIQCIGYVNLMNTSKTVPDVEHVFHASKAGSNPYSVYQNLFRYTEDSYESIAVPTFNSDQISIHSLLLHPKSRGTIRLKTASPFDFPLLNPNYLAEPEDAATLVAAIKDQFRMINTPALQKYNTTAIKVCHPSCNCSDFGSDDFWLCMVKAITSTVYHFSGTTKMGPKCNKDTVVDSSLKVHGVKNLRVADCSVIPVTTSGHTNAVAFMIGEKAADLLKECYCDGIVCEYEDLYE